VLYIGCGDERKFFAINPLNGREYWKRSMELLVFGGNAYSRSMLYVGTTIGKLHAIDSRTGKDVWVFESEGYQNNRSKFFKDDDTYRDDIYDIIKSNEQFLEAQYLLGGIFSTPAITNDNIVITTTEGIVYCLKR
jgi:eukaryotic-like serine/threonine-protein kinase